MDRLGPEATFLYNDAYIPVLSLAKHPWALGRPASEVWEEIWDFCGPLAEKVFRQGKATFVDDVRLFMNRGDYLEETYYSFSYSPIRDESGKVAGLFCPSSEVTSKILTTRRLHTLSELASRALVQKTTEAACESAADILDKNPDDIPFALLYLIDPEIDRARLEQTVRFPKGEPLLSPFFVDFAPNQDSSVQWPLAEVVENAQSVVISLEAADSIPRGLADQPVTQAIVLPLILTGQTRPVGVLLSGVNPARPLQGDYRTFYELVANQVSIAIQNAKASEEERDRLEQLAEIDRAKTVFFSNVSHEFRTPLTLMLGPLEEVLKKEDESMPPVLRQNIEAAHRNALRLQKLVNTLLDFSRIEAGRFQARFELVDLGGLTAELASSFRSLVEGAGMQLLVQCDPLPAVRADREMWEKIVLNLLSNAFKYTLKGSVTVSLQQVGTEAVLQVKDTGVGIPPEELPNLFKRFHRVANTQGRTYEGTGIGLSLVKELVLMHEGTITVDSEPGRGSTFTVRIPISKTSSLSSKEPLSGNDLPGNDLPGNDLSSKSLPAYLTEARQFLNEAQPAVADSVPESVPAEERFSGSPIRILVVDDNPDMRAYIQRLLEPHYRVQGAADGQAALQVIQSESPDLVISDIMMPVMDGEQLLRTLKASPATSSIPVMLLSARAGEEAKIDGYSSGADDYLTKPFSANELLARVRAQLKLARERYRTATQLRSLFEQAPAMIAILGPGPDFVFELANPMYGELVGRPTHQLVGKPLLEALPEVAGQGFELLLKQVTTTGRPHLANEAPVQLIRDGRPVTVYLNFTYQPRFEPDGSISGVLVLVVDVTEQVLTRRKVEESEKRYRRLADDLEIRVQERTLELNRSNTALERSNFDLMQFASVASHDLKEPLRKIQAFCSILLEQVKDKLSENEQSYFDRVINSAGRMQALVDNVLTLSKLSHHDNPVEETDLNAIVSDIIDDLEVTITEKQARVQLSPLPSIEAIPGQMHQLFQNLISNALKFNQSPAPIVSISAPELTEEDREWLGSRRNEYRKIRVQDNGIGFEPAYEEKIFGLFQRLHGRAYIGTGIGLAICKKIVESHHGAIRARSSLGQGSTFDVLLPLKQPDGVDRIAIK